MFSYDSESDSLFDDNAKRGKDDVKLFAKRGKDDIKHSRSRGDLVRTAAKMPQAILKISGYCKGTNHAKAHISYITRHGKLDLITNDESVLKGITASKELINDWSTDFGSRVNSRDMVKIVLSVPENSDPNKLKKAANEFLKEEFGNTNEYAYVLHTDTKKPHVHVVVKMVTYQGKKIDPRKDYLEKLRRDFAKCCRNNGVLVEASRRYQRGIAGKSKNTPVKQMRMNKHQNIKHDHRLKDKLHEQKASTIKEDNVPIRNKIIREEYLKTAIDLHGLAIANRGKDSEKSYLKAAKTLLDFAKNMPAEERFIDRLTAKIQGENAPKTDITFKQYQDILSKLDQKKLVIINQIESINKPNKNQKLDVGFDI